MEVDSPHPHPPPPAPDKLCEPGCPVFRASAETTELSCNLGAPTDSSFRVFLGGGSRAGEQLVSTSWRKTGKFIGNTGGYSLSRRLDWVTFQSTSMALLNLGASR